MSAANDEIRRQLGTELPHEPVDMADMAFSVHHHVPKKVEEEPSTLSEYELWDGDYAGITICAKYRFQELEEAMNRMIRVGMLYEDEPTLAEIAPLINESPWRGLIPANGKWEFSPCKVWFASQGTQVWDAFNWRNGFVEPEGKPVDPMKITRQMCK